MCTNMLEVENYKMTRIVLVQIAIYFKRNNPFEYDPII